VPEPRIVVLDDYFPRLETGFRVAEFSWLLEHHVVNEVMTTVAPLDEVAGPYRELHPELAELVTAYDAARLEQFDLAHVLFVTNAHRFLRDLVKAKLPFVLTIYPGGGLLLGTERGNRTLDDVFSSGLVRHVITTQPIVTDYIRARFSRVPVTEIIGVTTNPLYFLPGAGARRSYFGSGKRRLDVCFVAYRYAPGGADKGYPQFLDMVRGLRTAGVPLTAHVVGSFSAGELPDDDLGDDLKFYPPMVSAELRDFYLGMDVIVSPNQPHILAHGAFDGFPTGSVVEAALSGVAMLCADELNQNRLFRNGRSILIEPPEADALARRLLRLFVEPNGLRRIAQSGLREARRHYSVEAQLEPRAAVLRATADEIVELDR